VMYRAEIIRRGVCLSSIPSRLRRSLLKQRWFRTAAVFQPSIVRSRPVEEKTLPCVERCWPVDSMSFRPPSSMEAVYGRLKEDATREGVRLARGVGVAPPVRSALFREPKSLPKGAVVAFRVRWAWRWPRPVLDLWIRREYPVEWLDPRQRWADDHPDLTTEVTASFSVHIPPPACLQACCPCGGTHFESGVCLV
jgi:hypothetical protein